jgi:hypothetical protein
MDDEKFRYNPLPMVSRSLVTLETLSSRSVTSESKSRMLLSSVRHMHSANSITLGWTPSDDFAPQILDPRNLCGHRNFTFFYALF